MNTWRLIPWGKQYQNPPLDTRESFIQNMINNSVIALGWSIIGDLGVLNPKDQYSIQNEIKKYPNLRALNNWVSGGHSLWTLYGEMRPEDKVIITLDGKIQFEATIDSDYFFQANNSLLITMNEPFHRRVIANIKTGSNQPYSNFYRIDPNYNVHWPIIKLIP